MSHQANKTSTTLIHLSSSRSLVVSFSSNKKSLIDNNCVIENHAKVSLTFFCCCGGLYLMLLVVVKISNHIVLYSYILFLKCNGLKEGWAFKRSKKNNHRKTTKGKKCFNDTLKQKFKTGFFFCWWILISMDLWIHPMVRH